MSLDQAYPVDLIHWDLRTSIHLTHAPGVLRTAVVLCVKRQIHELEIRYILLSTSLDQAYSVESNDRAARKSLRLRVTPLSWGSDTCSVYVSEEVKVEGLASGPAGVILWIMRTDQMVGAIGGDLRVCCSL